MRELSTSCRKDNLARVDDCPFDRPRSIKNAGRYVGPHIPSYVIGELTRKQYALELSRNASRMNEKIEGIESSMYFELFP